MRASQRHRIIHTRERRRSDDQHHLLRPHRRRRRRQGRRYGGLDGPRAGARRAGPGAEGTTGSGGGHVYFSFNKSVAAGLLPNTPTTFTKLQVGADLVGIDLRGNRTPACLVAPPTTYVNGAGATVGYVAVGAGIPHINDLPPLPQFLIDLLHQRVTPPVGGDRGAQGRAHGPAALIDGA
jgi:hypothetical protein